MGMILGTNSPPEERGVRKPTLRRVIGGACALLFGACTGAEINFVEPEGPNLSVVGYVTIDLDPAYGVVILFDDTERPLASQIITAGRYGISYPLDGGTDVCSGYEVRAFVEDDFGARQDTVRLSAESGACTVPADTGIEHWIEFDLPPRAVLVGS
jgi:hypothetical protein